MASLSCQGGVEIGLVPVSHTDKHEYTDSLSDALEVVWGQGFLSPGGPEEVGLMLEEVEVADKHVLDLGCGTGGASFLLLENYGAGKVVGIDIEQTNIDKARVRAEKRGLQNRVEFAVVEPGPLAFSDAYFDIVFSKDTIVEVPDKAALIREAHRVLRPGGSLVLSNWFGGELEPSKEMQEWLEGSDVQFYMASLADVVKLLDDAGFEDVISADRTSWYAAYSRQEIARLEGVDRDRFEAIVGQQDMREWLDWFRLKATVVEQGHLRPGHVRGRKSL